MNPETVAHSIAALLRSYPKLADGLSAVEETDTAPGHYGFQIRTPDDKYFWIDVEEI